MKIKHTLLFLIKRYIHIPILKTGNPRSTHEYIFFAIQAPLYIFQAVSVKTLSSINMEKHFQHIFIMLVQDDRCHQDIQGIFGKENLKHINETLQKQFSVGPWAKKFNKETKDSMVEVVENLKRKKITRLDAQIDLLQLARKSTPIEAKIIRSLAALIEKLPKQALKDDIMEVELCHRFVDPFLSPLFDNPEEGVLFRWTSVTNQEARELDSGSISKKMPDNCISELDGLYFDASLGFAEIKPTSQAENKQALSKDLVRLGMLSKNAMDRWSIRGCLSIQVIGKIAKKKRDTLSDAAYVIASSSKSNKRRCYTMH